MSGLVERPGPHPGPDQTALASALRVGRVESLVLVAVLVLAAAAAAWWFLREPSASLEIEGAPIANAQQVLDTADPVFRAIAAADGATVVDDAGCWFAPPADDATVPGPRVACGPVALGIAGNNQRWLVGVARYQASFDGSGYQGTFDGFTGVAELAPGALRRPDGQSPPDADVNPPSEGVRTESGRRLTDAAAALEAADRAFLTVADEQDASTNDDSRCYLGVREAGGRRIAVGGAFCGPVLVLGSAPGDIWARVDVRPTDGDLLVDATIGPVDIRRIDATTALPPGTTLYRPDGEQPATDGPPLTPPQA